MIRICAAPLKSCPLSCSQAGIEQPRRVKTEVPFKIIPLLNGGGAGKKMLLLYLSFATGQSGRTWEAWQRWEGEYQKVAPFLGATRRNMAG